MTIAIVSLILAIMGLVFYLFTFKQIKTQRDEFRANMTRIARQIGSIRLAETEGWYVYQDWIDNIIDSEIGTDLVYIAIFDERDSLAAFTLNEKWLDLGRNSYLMREEQIEVVKQLAQAQVADESKSDFDHIRLSIQYGQELLGWVDVGFSLINFNNQVQRSFLINIYLLMLFTGVGVLSAVYISVRITRPLNQLSKALLAVSRGDLTQKVERSSNDELGTLSRSFNFMVERLREKSIIENFSRELSFVFEQTKMGELVTRQLLTALHADQGVLFLVEPRGKGWQVRSIVSEPKDNFQLIQFSIIESLHQALVRKGNNLIFLDSDLSIEERKSLSFLEQQLDFQNFKLMIPFVTQNVLRGFLLIPRPRRMVFSKQELSFFGTLNTQAALAIENLALVQELTQKERLEKEIEIARNVQRRLLPTRLPVIDGLEFTGICLPALEIGGDYYDFFPFNAHQLGIVVADVSGKGTSAAFYMAEIKGMMVTLAPLIASPKKLVVEINNRLYETIDRKVFATMIYGILDLHKKTFTFVRAGHNALYVKRHNPAQDIEVYIPQGIGLGLVKGRRFDDLLKEEIVCLEPNDILLIHTDGVTDAMDQHHEEFGEQRLMQSFLTATQQSCHAIQELLLDQIREFIGERPQFDDVTMVLARLLPFKFKNKKFS